MVFISNGQCMLWSQSVGNVFSNDLEIQIYWLNKQWKNSIFGGKMTVDKCLDKSLIGIIDDSFFNAHSLTSINLSPINQLMGKSHFDISNVFISK